MNKSMKSIIEADTDKNSLRKYSVDDNNKEKIIQKIVKELEKVEEIEFSFLHGSFIEEKSFRDIDIAVFFKPNTNIKAHLDICNKLSIELTRIVEILVDVNPLNSAPLSYCYYATQGKTLTYKNLEDVYLYKEDIWIKYMDFFPLLKDNFMDLINT